MIIIIEYILLSIKYYVEHFTCINSFNPYNSTRSLAFFSHLASEATEAQGKLNNLLKIVLNRVKLVFLLLWISDFNVCA